jgi:hypothetical protein
MGPVLLFNVGIVILLVGAASEGLDLVSPAIPDEMPIQELTPVI